MKDVFSKIMNGALFGVGVSGTCIIGILIVSVYFASNRSSRSHADFDNNEAKLIITNHDTRQLENGLAVLGTIKNDGEDAWQTISLEIEFFDKNENFIDECKGSVRDIINSGAEENFKIICGAGKNNTNKFPEFENITIKVESARKAKVRIPRYDD